MLRHLGTGCPVGLGIGSRILRVSPAFSIVRRIFAVIYTIFGYFWDNLPDFQQFWTDCGNFGTDFKHHLSVGFGLADQVPSRLRIISRSGQGLEGVGGWDKHFCPALTKLLLDLRAGNNSKPTGHLIC